jgi:hypothetical protein
MERKKQQASASPLVGWFVTAVLLSLPSSAAARRTPPRFGCACSPFQPPVRAPVL